MSLLPSERRACGYLGYSKGEICDKILDKNKKQVNKIQKCPRSSREPKTYVPPPIRYQLPHRSRYGNASNVLMVSTSNEKFENRPASSCAWNWRHGLHQSSSGRANKTGAKTFEYPSPRAKSRPLKYPFRPYKEPDQSEEALSPWHTPRKIVNVVEVLKRRNLIQSYIY